jgi:sulfur carrier protein
MAPLGVNKAVHIQMNGEPRSLPAGTTVGQLLQDLHIGPERVAVELNLQILERAEFERRAFQDGDRVEIIGFIGGGRP